MPTYVIQMEGSGTGLTSPAKSPTNASSIDAQPHLSLNLTRTIVIEPNNVGTSGGGTGGGEVSVVF
jgi:hypothetical protein